MTEQQTITDFIAARIADDEAAARAAQGTRWGQCDRRMNPYVIHDVDVYRPTIPAPGRIITAESPETRAHITRHDPARVLREAEAKRAILADHQIKPAAYPDPEDKDFGCQRCHFDSDEGVHGFGYCPTLLALAYIWNDHPDYQEAWRP